MYETILTLARTMTGGSDGEETLLGALCQAAETYWMGRLRPGVTAEGCGSAFPCAAAMWAAAGVLRSRSGAQQATAFTAGDVRVEQADSAALSAAAETLCRQAEGLMAPYVAWDDFAFYGVRT